MIRLHSFSSLDPHPIDRPVHPFWKFWGDFQTNSLIFFCTPLISIAFGLDAPEVFEFKLWTGIKICFWPRSWRLGMGDVFYRWEFQWSTKRDPDQEWMQKQGLVRRDGIWMQR